MQQKYYLTLRYMNEILDTIYLIFIAGYEYEKWDFMRRDLREVNALVNVEDDVFQQVSRIFVRRITMS